MKIIDYHICRGTSKSVLEDRVKEWLKYDFEPIGGVCFSPETSYDNDTWCQAMVKYEK